MKTHPLIKKIEQAGLLGRGCGTFPTAKKWQLVLNAHAKEKYVICNCSESEPGIFKDEFILNNYPEKVIEGIMHAMRALNARRAFIYLKPAYYDAYHQKLAILIDDDRIEIFKKPRNDYIGGEESALINLMEGNGEMPRVRPPFITSAGFNGMPTLVNNCETFYSVAMIAAGQYRHERFFSIAGDDTPRGVFRLPENLSVREALESSGFYPDFPFFIQLGGSAAGTCLRSDQLAGISIQNYAGLTIHRLDKDERGLVLGWLKFFVEESCGQCVPCREGTYRLYQMYQSGSYDTSLFNDIIFSMKNSSLCSFGKMAVNAITSYSVNIKRQDTIN